MGGLGFLARGGVFLKIYGNQRAFSLIEVIIVAGMMSVLSLGLTRIIVNQTKTVKTTESRLEIASTVDAIRGLLADRETCWQTFRITRTGATIRGVFDPNRINRGSITAITNKSGSKFYSTKIKLGSTSTMITFYSLRTTKKITPGNSGLAEFLVDFDRGKGIFGGQKLTRKINLHVLADSKGRMVDCSSRASNFEASATYVCATLGGTFDADGRNLSGDCAGLSINGDTSLEDALMVKGKATVEDDMTINAQSFLNGKSTVNGDLVLMDGFALNVLSDRRLKYGIKNLDSAINKINDMRPVVFRWRKNGRKEIGLIAQELKHLYPDLVFQTESSHLAIKYPQLAAVLIKGLQELSEKVHQLEVRLNQNGGFE